jgi:hypothetical protein
MLRSALCIGALIVLPAVASAQQLCTTTDGRQVVDEIYRHVLERAVDSGSATWVDRLNNGATVREVVRGIAKSREHIQRFGTEARDSVIRTMYRHILNREPDPEGHRLALELSNRRGVEAVVDRLIDSSEYQQSFGDWRVPGASGVVYCGAGTSQDLQSSDANGRIMRFRRMDTNNDGRVSRNEWRGNAQSFRNFDRNNDGVLSGAEVGAGGPWGIAGNPRNDEMNNDERFEYLDVNGNGSIDRNEWDGGYNAFTRLDLDGDRRLSRNEYNATVRASEFANVDVNRDGRIVLAEWPWSHTSFDRQDTNGDGVVSRGEYRGAPANQRK